MCRDFTNIFLVGMRSYSRVICVLEGCRIANAGPWRLRYCSKFLEEAFDLHGGRETAAPITNAGVALVPEGDHQKFSEALVQMLTDKQYRNELAVLSRNAHAVYFSWDAIAMKYLAALSDHHHI